MLTYLISAKIPTSFTQAKTNKNWIEPKILEFNALLNAGTWTLVPFKPNMNVVGSRWVFKIKENKDGSIEMYKARLVAKGFNQREKVDYEETFSPVIKSITIKIVFIIAQTWNWYMRLLDVSNAFLNEKINVVVDMKQPSRFVHRELNNHVCLLNKFIYGLKQTPRAQFQTLRNFLIKLQFQENFADSSLFTRTTTLGKKSSQFMLMI